MQQTKVAFWVHQAIVAMGVACLFGYSAPGCAQTNAAAPAASASSPTTPDQGDKNVVSKNKGVDKKVTDLSAISVTGQLAALRRAQAIKQDAVNVVDSVSAEEAGKFPDQNVADALQRVPGVSVNRSGGESNQIAVRGFGPDFVAVTLNGRQLPTPSGARAFNFDMLPSEIIDVAQVNKTSSADIPEVDIGGVVDIQTARPLDFHGFHGSGSFAGVDSTLSGGWSGKTTPKVSGLIGWTNSDNTFGWLLSGLYYKRDDTQISTSAGSWYVNQNISQKSGLSDPGYTHVAIPEALGNSIYNRTRTRQGFNGALDWRPFDRLNIKFDTMYSNYKINSLMHNFGEYGNTADLQSLTTDANNTVLNYVRKATPANVMSNDYVMASYPSDEKIVMNGLNFGFDIDPSTKLSLDVSNSQAWNKASPDGYYFVVGAPNIGYNPTWTNNGGDTPPTYSNIASTTDLNALKAHCCLFGDQSRNITNKINQYQLQLTKNFGDGALSRLEFGVQANDQYMKTVDVKTLSGMFCNVYCGYQVSVPANAIGAYVYTPPSPVGGVSQPGLPSQWIQYNPYAYAAYLASPAAYNQLTPDKRAALLAFLAANGGNFAPHPDPGSFNKVSETDRSAFIKAVFEGTAWDRPWVLDVGMRHLDVSSRSGAVFQALTSYTVDPHDTSAAQVTYGPLQPQSASGGYNSWLPSLNFKLNLRDNLIFRLALSKTLTPPQLSNLFYNVSYSTRPDARSISQGNPQLQPYTSKNFDTGLEWYLDDVSYLALTGFYKKVANFSTTITTPIQFLGQTWAFTQPINLNTADIYGEEFTFNYQFANLLPAPFDGLGVAFNYTHVSSSTTLNPSATSPSGTFAVPGIGDSANLSGYYEKGPWQVRLAYNWRGSYLASIAKGSGGQPDTRAAYGQLDLSASYKINDHVSIFASGTNLTREHLSDYSVYPNRFLYAEADGSVYMVGVRGNF